MDKYKINEAQERKDWNRWDVGMGANAGIELFRYCRIFFGYERGLRPVWKKIDYIDADDTTVNVCKHIGLSVLF